MQFNPKPIFDLDILKYSRPDEVEELNWLYSTLLMGGIPDRPPYPFEKLEVVAFCFRMWAFIYSQLAAAIVQALVDEFGTDLFCLEIMAGMGWLAKALKHAGLPGVYIATDLRPAPDAVFPVAKMDATEAVIMYRDHISLYIVSWPPFDDLSLTYALDYIPKDSYILYLGEPFLGRCASKEFFERTIPVAVKSPYWALVKHLYFAWPKNQDSIFLLQKVK